MSQNAYAVAVGFYAGFTGQGTGSVAVGAYAGSTGQGANAVAIGFQAGQGYQGANSVAIGYQAGFTGQNANSVAIGYQAGYTGHGTGSIAIGYQAGFQDSTGPNSIAIGTQAGLYGLGSNSIAIGNLAGPTGAAYNNNIILNAGGVALNPNTGSAFYASPIRNSYLGTTYVNDLSNVMFYNSITNEITYAPISKTLDAPQLAYYDSTASTTLTLSSITAILYDSIDASNTSLASMNISYNSGNGAFTNTSATTTLALSINCSTRFTKTSPGDATIKQYIQIDTIGEYGPTTATIVASIPQTVNSSSLISLVPGASFAVYISYISRTGAGALVYQGGTQVASLTRINMTSLISNIAGPQGPTGMTGPTGPQGVQGNAGAATGNTLLTNQFTVSPGSGAPANAILHSYDGVSWINDGSGGAFTGSGIVNGVAWNGILWVAGAAATTGNSLAYSVDGIRWTGLGTSIFTTSCNSIAWNGSIWVAVGYGASTDIAYSTNGINWTAVPTSFLGRQGTTVATNGSMFVAGGSLSPNLLAYSYDGINWANTTGAISGGANPYYKNIASNGSIWVAVGSSSGGTGYQIAYSYDGINWVGAATPFGSQGTAVAWNGSFWVATGSTGVNVSTSVNGISWSAAVAVGGGGVANNICWNGAYWILKSGQVLYSGVSTSASSGSPTTIAWSTANYSSVDQGSFTTASRIVLPYVPFAANEAIVRSNNAIALGNGAGLNYQGNSAVAIGYQAGFTGQNANSVAIGYQAGYTGHGTGSIAIGYQAGFQDSTGPNSIAIGTQAGQYGLGANSIAIGNLAGPTGAAYNNNIILNASGTGLSPNTGSAFYVAPIRNSSSGTTYASDITQSLYYNDVTDEITYAPSVLNSKSGTGYILVSPTGTAGPVTSSAFQITNTPYGSGGPLYVVVGTNGGAAPGTNTMANSTNLSTWNTVSNIAYGTDTASGPPAFPFINTNTNGTVWLTMSSTNKNYYGYSTTPTIQSSWLVNNLVNLQAASPVLNNIQYTQWIPFLNIWLGGYYQQFISSPDGINFSQVVTGLNTIYAIVSDSAYAVIGGVGNATYSSKPLVYTTNGTSFTAITSSTTSGTVNAIATNGSGTWLAGYATGAIQRTTTNPTGTWTAETSPFSTSCFGLASNGTGTFVACGQGTNTLAYNTTGTTWNAIAAGSSFGASGIGYDVIWTGTQFVAVGTNGTSGVILTSSDGITWASATSPTMTICRKIRYSNPSALSVPSIIPQENAIGNFGSLTNSWNNVYAKNVLFNTSSISLGYNYGLTGTVANSITINATSTPINPTNAGFYVNPIRSFVQTSGIYSLYYDFNGTSVSGDTYEITVSSSDRRLKTDISDTQLGLEFINSLRPVEYRWRDKNIGYLYNDDGSVPDVTNPGTRLHEGFIAQEVKEALDSFGVNCGIFMELNDGPDKIKGLNALRYDEFIGPIVKAIQEQNKLIQTQQGIIQRQQQQIDTIMTIISPTGTNN